MTPTQVLAKIDELFTTRGDAEYHGEAVTQLEHALQSATLAEQDGQPAHVIAAALLHDVGHFLHNQGEDYLDRGINDRHEDMAARFLAQAYGPEVTEPVRLHVSAKRYLATKRPGYREALSPASIKSLELQGGLMTAEELKQFEALPTCAAAVAVREYDDRAKIVGQPTPTYADFRHYLVTTLKATHHANASQQ